MQILMSSAENEVDNKKSNKMIKLFSSLVYGIQG